MDDPANAALLGVPTTVALVGGDDFGGPAVGHLTGSSTNSDRSGIANGFGHGS
jgi:hypothetical protein